MNQCDKNQLKPFSYISCLCGCHHPVLVADDTGVAWFFSSQRKCSNLLWSSLVIKYNSTWVKMVSWWKGLILFPVFTTMFPSSQWPHVEATWILFTLQSPLTCFAPSDWSECDGLFAWFIFMEVEPGHWQKLIIILDRHGIYLHAETRGE